jgi:all-trans-8'-apo-beta-carotenal 15,15'-oxygenase
MGFDLHKQTFAPTPWSLSNGGPKLEKWIISIDDKDQVSAVGQAVNSVISDMPTFHPDAEGGRRPARYIYTVCGIRPVGWFPFNAVAKHDTNRGTVEVWPPAARRFAQEKIPWNGGTAVYAEPLFVPRRDSIQEDDGWVLSIMHETSNNTTALEIFDASNFQSGPITTIPLSDSLWGWNVHSTFVAR